jgi:CRP-like cAMP-binding protein
MIDFSNPFDLAGIAGVMLYLGAYFLLQTGLLHGAGLVFGLMNLAGASLVLVSLQHDFNLFSAVIQISWIAISIIGLVRVVLSDRLVRFTPDDAALVASKLSHLSRRRARRFLDRGQWMDVKEPTVLIEQGQPSPALYYLAEGAAEVHSDGIEIARVVPESFLGEVTVLSREPATATVTALPGARLFRVAHGPLRQLVTGDPDMGSALGAALNSDLRAKLAAANRQIGDQKSTSVNAV